MPYAVVLKGGNVYGVGSEVREAKREAKDSIVYDLEEEIDSLSVGDHTFFDDYLLAPCTEEFMESVRNRGGHTEWELNEGTVVLTGSKYTTRFDLFNKEHNTNIQDGDEVRWVEGSQGQRGHVAGANRFTLYVEDENDNTHLVRANQLTGIEVDR